MKNFVSTLISAVFISAPVFGETLTIPQALQVGIGALRAGDVNVSYDISRAILSGQPNNVQALLIFAESARIKGETQPAIKAAQKALRLAQIKEQKFDAAHTLARAHFTAGNATRAEWYLRRAAQLAPNEQMRMMSAKDFANVHAQNPWRVRLSFSIAPSSNINNGVDKDLLIQGLQTAYGITLTPDNSNLPLSGLAYSAGLSLQYRTLLSPTARMDFGINYSSKTYTFSQKTKDLNTGKTPGDFASKAVQFAIGVDFAPATSGRSWSTRRVELSHSKNWYGGAPSSNATQVRLSQDMPLGQKAMLRVAASVDHLRQIDSDKVNWHSSNGRDLSLNWFRAINGGHQLVLGATVSARKSDANWITNRGWSLGAELRWRGNDYIRPSLSINYGQTDYYRHTVPNIGTRKDKIGSVGVNVLLPKLNYMGFAPVVSFGASRNLSTVPIYTTDRTWVNIGIESTF